MRRVHVAAGKPYDVLIGRGLLQQAGEYLLQTLGAPCTAALLTDDTVDALYGEAAENALRQSGFRTFRFAVPHGEAHKELATWHSMLDALARAHMTRTDVVVALGGGVPGDMAGFAAATYLRGVRFVQLPTTLLAMVDSSVGGKMGVNLSSGKNQVGAFHQPSLVLCDPDVLGTLPQDFLADGVAEVIKYGVLGDEALFSLMESGAWQAHTEQVIETCVQAKADLVRQDERDTGSRQLLNLGHTLGHGIERCSGYAFSHGHAVGVGMVYAARLAARLGLCAPEVEARIQTALTQNGLPTSAPYSAQALLDAALADKKRAGDTLTFVLPRAIGHCELYPVKLSELPELIAQAVAP